jgi:hypothetical protein
MKRGRIWRPELLFSTAGTAQDRYKQHSRKYDIQQCFICRPSDSTVSKDAGIEPRTVAITALAVRPSNNSARYQYHPEYLVHKKKTYKKSPFNFLVSTVIF